MEVKKGGEKRGGGGGGGRVGVGQGVPAGAGLPVGTPSGPLHAAAALGWARPSAVPPPP